MLPIAVCDDGPAVLPLLEEGVCARAEDQHYIATKRGDHGLGMKRVFADTMGEK